VKEYSPQRRIVRRVFILLPLLRALRASAVSHPEA
jgi:hypothetical protein